MSEPANQTGMVVNRDHFNNYIKLRLRTEQPSIVLLEEKFDTVHMSMMFTRNLPYTEKFLQKVNEMTSNGLTKKFYQEMVSSQELNKKKEEVDPQVLTLSTLRLGFLSFLIALGLSTIVFISECSLKLLKRLFC
jgi:murein L,D-transpeptidase YcbB/YkuD